MNGDRAGTKSRPNSRGEVMNGGRGGSKSCTNPNSEASTKSCPNIGGGGPGGDMKLET